MISAELYWWLLLLLALLCFLLLSSSKKKKDRQKTMNCMSLLPDRPFHNFEVTRSGSQRIWFSSAGTSCDGFWSSKVAEGSVGSLWYFQKTKKLKKKKTKNRPFHSARSWLNLAEYFRILEPQNMSLNNIRFVDPGFRKLWNCGMFGRVKRTSCGRIGGLGSKQACS